MRTIGEAAELAGVSVRALHHYDEIGLLSPSERSEAGYRLYSYEDLTRLQQILIWRALGYALAEIGPLLDDAARDRVAALRRQRELVERERERLGAIVDALDAALRAQEQGTKVKETSMFEGFENRRYEDEVRERWGHTEAYRESARRSAEYGDTDWGKIKAESQAIVAEFVALMRAGEPAEGDSARAVAERHREQISRWFYPCSVELHRRLGEMYVADPRYASNYEKHAEGLAAYVREAIAANAAGRAGVRR
jgi:DNA-binding transcriptional MerR regulator